MEEEFEEISVLQPKRRSAPEIRVQRRFPVSLTSLFLLLSFILFLPGTSIAGEIKVRDDLGFLRAFGVGDGEVAVEVTVDLPEKSDQENSPSLVLSNVDGIASDIQPIRVRDNVFVFNGVVEGTWRVSGSKKGIVVSEVKILGP